MKNCGGSVCAKQFIYLCKKSAEASDNEEVEKPTVSAAAVSAIKKNKWADEDADEEVKEDWEASESEEEKPKNETTKPKGPVRNKGITKMKIAEKEAEEALRLAEQEALAEQAADPVLRKKLEQTRTIQADMENTRGLFGDAVISNPNSSEDPMKMNPKQKMNSRQSAVSIRAAKDAKKGKGKQKPTLGGGGASTVAKGGRGVGADLEAYDQALDDEFDDFM
ncbi:hypothetical protein H4Q26_014963 [Puccinia striiformis f. sp. tritici PST-130]|nr:hypothetical protein H4Q26_014963 [Puccinia striiformis f. sp. tritici PST-130]